MKAYLAFILKFTCILFYCSSCSKLKIGQKAELSNEKILYNFSDTSGTYQLKREIGILEKKQEVFVKTQLLPEDGDENKALEKSIVIANFAKIKTKEGTIKVLRPRISQYTIWFDGKKFFSQMEVDFKNKKIEVSLISPEKKWRGKSSTNLPDGNGVYCFFSQIVECVKITDFLHISADKKAGQMSFKMIWDKFPYLQEYYSNIPYEMVSDAIFSYDGESEGFDRFILKVAGQSIFYHFDKNQNFVKKFWVVQGISQVRL